MAAGNRLRRWERAISTRAPTMTFSGTPVRHSLDHPGTLTSQGNIWFAAPTDADLEREHVGETLVAENLKSAGK